MEWGKDSHPSISQDPAPVEPMKDSLWGSSPAACVNPAALGAPQAARWQLVALSRVLVERRMLVAHLAHGRGVEGDIVESPGRGALSQQPLDLSPMDW